MPLYIYGPLSTVAPNFSLQYIQTNGTVNTNSGYTVISYTNTAGGSLNFTYVPSNTTIYYLAVGGGGSGGMNCGGGGGGGAVTYGAFTLSTTTNISISVGIGGPSKPYNASTAITGSRGGNSIISGSGISTITAGGGAGGGGTSSSTTNVISDAFGGSGGGGNGNSTSPYTSGGTVPTLNARTYANKGGNYTAEYGGGGGGGAGSAGANGTASTGGNGGDGKLYSSFSSDSSNYNTAINNILMTLPGYNTALGAGAGYLGAGGGASTGNGSGAGAGG